MSEYNGPNLLYSFNGIEHSIKIRIITMHFRRNVICSSRGQHISARGAEIALYLPGTSCKGCGNRTIYLAPVALSPFIALFSVFYTCLLSCCIFHFFAQLIRTFHTISHNCGFLNLNSIIKIWYSILRIRYFTLGGLDTAQ